VRVCCAVDPPYLWLSTIKMVGGPTVPTEGSVPIPFNSRELLYSTQLVIASLVYSTSDSFFIQLNLSELPHYHQLDGRLLGTFNLRFRPQINLT